MDRGQTEIAGGGTHFDKSDGIFSIHMGQESFFIIFIQYIK
jgi:hypothetical protein